MSTLSAKQTAGFSVTEKQLAVADRHLNVMLVDMPGLSSVTVLLLANTGSRYETEQEEGLAHFFEHMVFKGTEHFPTAKLLSEALDRVGADFNAFTSKEYTGYYVRAASRNFSLAVEVLSDMILQPKLLQEDIDRESGVIIEELNMYADMPARQIESLFEEKFYRERGLAHDIVGRKETIKAFKRQDFENLLNRAYGLENLQLVIAGGLESIELPGQKTQKLDRAALWQFLAEQFAKTTEVDRERGKQRQPEWQKESIHRQAFSKERFLLQPKKTEQAHFILAWPALSRKSEKRPVEALLATILGGTMSSRLFTEVREKRGLAYYVSASDDFYHDAGVLACSAGVDPQRLQEAMKVSKAVFEDLASGRAAISEQELDLAKNYLKGKLVLGLEASTSVAQFFGLRKLLSDEVLQPKQLIKRYDAVSKEQLQQLAAEIIQDDAWRFAVIADAQKEEKLRAILET
jgi:predicted Zn-dependent peptidase